MQTHTHKHTYTWHECRWKIVQEIEKKKRYNGSLRNLKLWCTWVRISLRNLLLNTTIMHKYAICYIETYNTYKGAYILIKH